MIHHELALNRIVEMSKQNESNLIEATVDFCEENDLDLDEFITDLDAPTIERLKMSALESNLLRKKDFKRSPSVFDIGC